MAVQEFAVADGFDNTASLVNVENHLYDRATKPRRVQLIATPVSVGETPVVTLDRKTHYDGAQPFEWQYRVLSVSALETAMLLILGSTTADNNAVTVRTRDRLTNYGNYNCEVTLEPGYELRKGRDGLWYALGVVFAFQVIEAL